MSTHLLNRFDHCFDPINLAFISMVSNIQKKEGLSPPFLIRVYQFIRLMEIAVLTMMCKQMQVHLAQDHSLIHP
jgi:hypothetical protein